MRTPATAIVVLAISVLTVDLRRHGLGRLVGLEVGVLDLDEQVAAMPFGLVTAVTHILRTPRGGVNECGAVRSTADRVSTSSIRTRAGDLDAGRIQVSERPILVGDFDAQRDAAERAEVFGAGIGTTSRPLH